MKKICILLFLGCFFCANTQAQYVDIADVNLKNALMLQYPSCFNSAGQMDTTCTAIVNEDTLILANQSISQVDELRYFDHLKHVNLSYNYFVVLNNLPDWIESLTLNNNWNNLTSISLPSSLKRLICTNNNQLGGIDNGWPAGLKYLDLSNDAFTFLSGLPATLDTLIVPHQIDIFGAMAAQGYDYPKLLSIALPTGLKYLNCSQNSIPSLTGLPNTLTWLDCSSQYFVLDNGPAGYRQIPKLTEINNLPASLTYLKCNNNSLTSLPALPASLQYINAGVNSFNIPYDDFNGNTFSYTNPGIYGIASFPSAITYINIAYNNISCLPYIPAGVQTLTAGGNLITCLPNSLPPGLVNTDMSAKPLCNPVNNIYQCERHPIIAGTLFYDNNSNGLQDPGELPRANVRAQLDNGTYAFSNIDGYYEFSASIGAHTVTIDAPPYYNAVPSTVNHTITLADEIVTDLIPLQPAVSVGSMKLTVINTSDARPGFPLTYQVKYENVGTTILSPSIIVDYDESRLTYTNSSNASVINNGQDLQLSLSNIQPGQKGFFTAVFTVNPSVPIGDIIWAKGTVSGGADVSQDSIAITVIGSFDPNDKQATPSLTRQQVDAGAYIDYLVRFQNTGTADAINVVVADTLNITNTLVANTLQMIDASHSCKLTQVGNVLYAYFKDIHLPSMNTNEPQSHGYLRFRIKPLSTLPDNSIVRNRASIYFDFNAPVGTGFASTIVNLVAVPVTLQNFTVKKESALVNLFWTTAQEVNSRSFVIERSTDQRSWNIIASVIAAGNSSSARNYTATDFHPAKGINYYRLKSMDIDNKFSYSEIKPVYFGDDINVMISPNPAKDKINIYLPGNSKNVNVELFSMNGQLIRKDSTKEQVIFMNVSDIQPGLYILKIKGVYINEVRKLMIE